MEVGRIDVFIHDHDPTAGIDPGPAIGGEHARLLGVPRIHLLDRYHVEEPPGARLMVPHALYAGEARFLDLVPDHRGLHHRARDREIGWRPRGDRQRQNRIVAVIDAPDLDDRLLAGLAGVIAHELPERSFHLLRV